MTRKKATFIGLLAILLWALLALFTVYTGNIPPFQLTAMSFSIAFMLIAIKWIYCRDKVSNFFKLDARLWALGVCGLFGYHFFYFLALKSAPPAEAGLIAYLWPLLIVIFSALLPNEKLYWFHVVGALISLMGAALLITKGEALHFNDSHTLGYLAAFACAFIWSGYSVLSRKFAAVSTDVVGAFCLATAFLSTLCHLYFEVTVWPADIFMWLAVIGLGLGPVGGAFFLWDIGVKHGDIQGLGVLSYLSPLLSTILLLIFSGTAFSWPLFWGCALITAGAIVGSLRIFRDLLASRSR